MVSPVPVGLNTGIAAFIDESLFIGMDEIAVLVKEYGLSFHQFKSVHRLEWSMGYMKIT